MTARLLTFPRLVTCSLLFFAFSAFNWTGQLRGWRLLLHITLPLAAVSLIWFQSTVSWKKKIQEFLTFLLPFYPWLIALAVVLIAHGNINDSSVALSRNLQIILACGVIHSCIANQPRLLAKYLFLSCSFAIFLYFANCVYVAWSNHLALWQIKDHVFPYNMTYARCICLISGIALIGFFQDKQDRLRWLYLGSSLLGFFTALGCIAVRSVILTPIFACLAYFLISRKGGLKSAKFLFSCLIIILLLSAIFFVFPIGTRFTAGITEVSASLDAISSMNLENPEANASEALSTVNSNMGARIAVWAIGLKQFAIHWLIGTGFTAPSHFTDIDKLFPHWARLEHFHSDWMVCAVSGGLVHLVGFILTQLLLLIQSRNNPIRLFLVLSMLSFGVVDIGYLDILTFTFFMSAWTLAASLDVTKEAALSIKTY
jgi:hypothetical protein